MMTTGGIIVYFTLLSTRWYDFGVFAYALQYIILSFSLSHRYVMCICTSLAAPSTSEYYAILLNTIVRLPYVGCWYSCPFGSGKKRH